MRTPDIPSPVRHTRRPNVAFPPGACDCHAHVFGPQSQYPIVPDTHYVPQECLLPDYVRMLRTIGCERAVLVQPSVYGTDNRAMLDALTSGAFPLRGVAVVREDATDRELEDLHAAGVRGIRINIASATAGLKLEHAPRLAERIRHLGWHLQIFMHFQPELAGHLASLRANIVIDHFGGLPAVEGPDSPRVKALLELLRREHCWAKLMGPYFASQAAPRYADLVPLARAMVEAAPDRLVWGTDWPHPGARAHMPDDGELADMLAEWVPDKAQRRRILADNPQRLYDF